jgi:hypothetical protein
MQREIGFQKTNKPLYYQSNKGKISHQKKSSDFKYDNSIKNMYNNYYQTGDFIQPYKRTQSPLSININSNLPFRINKLNDTYEKLNFDFNNISSIFNINTENITDLPDLSNENILDFDIYSPITNLDQDNNDIYENNNFEDNLSPLCKYGLRYIKDDIYNCENVKNDKIIFLQSCIRGFLLKKKLNFNLLNKLYLERRNIKKIIIIQKNIRCFLAKLKIRKKIIINYIKQKRKKAINIIIKKMQSYNNKLKMKKLFFIKNKIEERNKYARYIQETYRNYKFYSSFKKLLKEMNEKYFIIYPCKGKKVELIIYLEENKKLVQKKYTFIYNKLLQCFILFINPNKLDAGKYKCQFIIDDIVICDKNYPYTQFRNELYNIIEFGQNNEIKEERKKKKKKKEKSKIGENIIRENIVKDNKRIKNYKNNFYNDEYNDELEDIKEEEDEGKSTTSKDYMKKIKEYIDIEDIDFTDEDIINIKKLKGNSILATDYKKLREDLIDKNPVNKEEKIRKNSFKIFKFNY